MSTTRSTNRSAAATKRADAINDALERLAGYGYLDMPGPFACHGPMGAETLSTLGHDDLVGAWIEGYKSRHEPLDTPPRIDRIDPTDEGSWRPALGDSSRASDWTALFAGELQDSRGRLWSHGGCPGYYRAVQAG